MNFALNDEQLEWQQRCRAFATDVIRPAAPIHDREESVPWEVMKAANAAGLSGLAAIERTGSDPDGLFGPIYAEEMHFGCAGIALAILGAIVATTDAGASGSGPRGGEVLVLGSMVAWIWYSRTALTRSTSSRMETPPIFILPSASLFS